MSYLSTMEKINWIKCRRFCKENGINWSWEILINNIDRDGILSGYDMDLISEVRQKVNIPITALGGAGKLADISEIFKEFGIIGASAGSIFVFKGKYRAVLIQYPSEIEKNELLNARG